MAYFYTYLGCTPTWQRAGLEGADEVVVVFQHLCSVACDTWSGDMIRHASIYEARERSDADGVRVLVMRQWPRAVRKDQIDLWLRDAGPTKPLLQAYQQGELAWADFERRYRLEMLQDRAWILDRLRHLEREHGVLTLLCHERIPPAEHCHRQILVDILAERSTRPAHARGGPPDA